ncbi:MAG: hypothetical protein E7Z96_06585 [Actinomycetaceae bacterium]|nr:hypothetical protein [Actinomycetaceae bacterium]
MSTRVRDLFQGHVPICRILNHHSSGGACHRPNADGAAKTHWIERTYHRKRRQRALSKLTPIEYETILEPAASLAA